MDKLKNASRLVSNEIKWYRVLKYISGMICIAFGVVMMLRSNLGNSSWDTLHYSITLLSGITIGTAMVIVALLFTILVIWLNKDFKFLLMAIPILLVGPLVDLFNDVIFINFHPEQAMMQIVSLIAGLLFLPFGGSLLIISTYPAGVFDEFNLAVMRKLKMKSLVPIRVIMELSAVSLATIFFYMTGETINQSALLPIYGNIGIGTLIFAFTVGILLKFYLKLFERIGLNENQQND